MYDATAAIAGAGFMGSAHAEALRRLQVPVAGILGSSEEKSRRAARNLGLATAYSSYTALLADPQVQVVHIATPNRFHFQMARDALRAGKHVLCEKPLAMTSAESAELVGLAAETGLAAGVNYNIRFYPLCVEARARVQAGELGEIFSAQGSYVQDWLFYPTDYNWRVLPEEGGRLRAVADIGTHWLDLVQTITGRRIEAVLADLKTVHTIRHRPQGEVETFQSKGQQAEGVKPIPIQTEDEGSVLLRFEGGARGNLWVSQVTAGRKNCLRCEIAGSNGALAWNSEEPNTLWIGHRDRPNESLIRDPGLVSAAARAFIGYPGGHNEGFPDTFKQCFRAFYDAVTDRDTAPLYPTFADGHQEMRLCDAIFQSHQDRGWVAL